MFTCIVGGLVICKYINVFTYIVGGLVICRYINVNLFFPAL